MVPCNCVSTLDTSLVEDLPAAINCFRPSNRRRCLFALVPRLTFIVVSLPSICFVVVVSAVSVRDERLGFGWRSELLMGTGCCLFSCVPRENGGSVNENKKDGYKWGSGGGYRKRGREKKKRQKELLKSPAFRWLDILPFGFHADETVLW